MATDKEKYELNCKMIIKLQNENDEIINRMFKIISIDDYNDEYTSCPEDFDYYIEHIVKKDGITINGILHKWKRYRCGYTSRIDFKDLYDDYKKYNNELNYYNIVYDDFMEALPNTYEGIIKVWDGYNHKYRMSFNRDLIDGIEKWVTEVKH